MNKIIDLDKKYQFILLIFLITIFGILAIYGGQDNGWDMLDYHYYNGYAFLNNRYFYDIVPAMVQTHLNPGFELINYWLFSQKAAFAVFMLGAITGVSTFIAFKIAMILFNEGKIYNRVFYSIMAVIIGVSGNANFSTLGLATNDNKMGVMVMLSLFFIIKFFITQESKRKKWLIASGIVIGFATGFKLVAGLYAIGLGIALLFSDKFNVKHIKTLIIFAASILAGFLIVNGYWMYFLYKNFNSPLFPYYNNFFQSQYTAAISFKDHLYHPQHHLTLPLYLAFDRNVFPEKMLDSRLAVLYILSIILILQYFYKLYSNKYSNKKLKTADNIHSTNSNYVIWKFLIIWFLVSYIIWFFSFTIYRYIIPHEFIAGIFIVFLLRKFIPKINALAIISLLVYFYYSTIYMGWGVLKFKDKNDLKRDSFVIENIPELPLNSVIFLDAPNAYLIPFFPKEIKFVGLNHAMNTYHLHDETIFRKMALELLYNHKIPRYIMVNKLRLTDVQKEFYKAYGIIQNKKCFELKSNVSYLGPLQICQITIK